MEKVLDREEFKRLVYLRSRGRCVFCGREAKDPHHILERKLYPGTQGYFLSNGAAVCNEHHWDCETTRISVEDVRKAAGITLPALPPGFDPNETYDKWGNRLRPDGLWEPGPLFLDTGARKALAAGGKLGLFVPKGC
jgi:rRNA maturation protein Nop10